MNSKMSITIWSIIRGNTLDCVGFKMLSSGRKKEEGTGGWLIRNRAEICSFKGRWAALIKGRVRITQNYITMANTAMILTIKSNSNETL